MIHRPVHVDFNVTNACNLACSHCHASSGDCRPSELSLDEACAGVDDLHRAGAVRIAFGGGEPFVRSDMVDILAHACRLPGWRVSVITNGTYLTDRRVQELSARCPGLNVNVSVEGPDAETFGRLRRQRSATADHARLFEKVLEGVRRTVASGVSCSVNMTLTPQNSDKVQETYRLFVEKLGADALVAIKFFPAGFGLAHLDKLEFEFQAWAQLLLLLTREKERNQLAKLQLSVPAPWEFYLPFILHGFDLQLAEQLWHFRSALLEPSYADRSVADSTGVSELCVSSTGKLYPSVLLDGAFNAECGDLREGVDEVWSNSSTLHRFRTVQVKDITVCDDCLVNKLCGGGSRARAFLATGSFTAPDAGCPLVRRMSAN